MAPPQPWVNFIPANCGKVFKKVSRQCGEGLGVEFVVTLNLAAEVIDRVVAAP